MSKPKVVLHASRTTGIEPSSLLNYAKNSPAMQRSADMWIERYLSLRASWGKADATGRRAYLPVSEWQPNISEMPAAIDALLSLSVCDDASSFRIPVRSWPIVRFIQDVLLEQGTRVHISRSDHARWMIRSVKDAILRYMNLGVWCFDALRAQRIYSGETRTSHTDILAVTRYEKRSFRSERTTVDVYLGDLSERLSEAGREVVSIGRLGFEARGTAIALAKSEDSSKNLVIYSFVKPTDVIKAAFSALLFKVRTPKLSDPFEKAAAAEARNHVCALAECFLIEAAITEAVKQLQPKLIVCMQENACWERAVVIAAKKSSAPLPTVGFFHCPVMPSALRYHNRTDIERVEPHFDLTLTLGEEACRTLQALGQPASYYRPGAAFRDIQLPKTESTIRKGSNMRVLILLGGAFDNYAFSLWLQAALSEVKGIDLVFRAHPTYPAEHILAALNEFKKGPIIEKSNIKDPSDDIAASDCVIYKGTTVGFAALNAEVPAIHVQSIGVATDDILFQSQGLGFSVAGKAELAEVIEKIRDGYKPNLTNGPKYVASYFDRSEKAKERSIAEILALEDCNQ